MKKTKTKRFEWNCANNRKFFGQSFSLKIMMMFRLDKIHWHSFNSSFRACAMHKPCILLHFIGKPYFIHLVNSLNSLKFALLLITHFIPCKWNPCKQELFGIFVHFSVSALKHLYATTWSLGRMFNVCARFVVGQKLI